MSCPDISGCEKKVCADWGVCGNSDFWANYWRERVKVEQGTSRQKIRARPQVDGLSIEPRLCPDIGKKCNKRRVCSILGECLFENERTKSRPDLFPALRSARSAKEVSAILEIIMPSLKRMNFRKFYKPDKNKEEN